MKSVTFRHPRASSNLLQAMTLSQIVTQGLESVEKTNIFNVKLVTIEHQNYYKIIKAHTTTKKKYYSTTITSYKKAYSSQKNVYNIIKLKL